MTLYQIWDKHQSAQYFEHNTTTHSMPTTLHNHTVTTISAHYTIMHHYGSIYMHISTSSSFYKAEETYTTKRTRLLALSVEPLGDRAQTKCGKYIFRLVGCLKKRSPCIPCKRSRRFLCSRIQGWTSQCPKSWRRFLLQQKNGKGSGKEKKSQDKLLYKGSLSRLIQIMEVEVDIFHECY